MRNDELQIADLRLPAKFRLLVPGRFHAEIVSHAQAELPNECCGMLGGLLDNTGGDLVGRVLRRYSLVNAAASPKEFESEPRSMFAAEQARRAEGLEFLAIYHSHPSSRPVPSARDLERCYSPEVVNLIVSLEADVPEIRGWWLDRDGYREAEIEWVEDVLPIP